MAHLADGLCLDCQELGCPGLDAPGGCEYEQLDLGLAPFGGPPLPAPWDPPPVAYTGPRMTAAEQQAAMDKVLAKYREGLVELLSSGQSVLTRLVEHQR